MIKETFTPKIALEMLVASCEALLCFAKHPEDWANIRDRATVFYLKRNTQQARELLNRLASKEGQIS